MNTEKIILKSILALLLALAIKKNKNKMSITGISGITGTMENAIKKVDDKNKGFDEFVGKAINKKYFGRKEIWISEQQKQKINNLLDTTEIDKFIIRATEIRHIMNRHYGDKEHEKKNIPLTMDDIKNIPYLLNFGQLRRQTNNLRLDAYGVEFYVYVPNGEKISLMISPRTDDNGDTLFLWNMRIERR